MRRFSPVLAFALIAVLALGLVLGLTWGLGAYPDIGTLQNHYAELQNWYVDAEQNGVTQGVHQWLLVRHWCDRN